jgi:uncharacterized membrane protein
VATLTVLEFDNATGADQMVHALGDLQRQRLITVQDAAVVSWPQGAKKPKTQQLHNLAATGALGGAFWGMLFGLIFFVPILGAAVGAGIGALAGAMTDVGIDDKFIEQARSKLTPGSSMLFALTSDAVPDRVAAAFQGMQGELITTNLDNEDEAKLREMFADVAAAPRS